MKARKWNFETREYEDYELPDGATTYEHDMDKVVVCAQCGLRMLFGAGYTSRQIHTPGGFGYCVCASCHLKEFRDEREAEKHDR